MIEVKAENQGLSNKVIAYGLAFAVANIFNALLVIIKENVAPLKNWMAAFTGHHWGTHGLLTIVLFVALALILSKQDLTKFENKLINIVIWSVIISFVLINGFFLSHVL
jgi:hypothetical protein